MQYADIKGQAELLKTSTGEALDALVALLGLTRQESKKATAKERFLLAEARADTVAVPAGTRVKTQGGRYFNTLDYAEIPPGATYVDTIVQAEEAGAESSGILAGEINILVDPIRYMDDVIILGQDKETLHRWKAAVETFLQEELALDLNSKTSIRPVCQGVEFVGVRIWPTHMKLRKSTVRRIKREVRKISALYAAGDMTRQDFYRRIASIRGLLKHTESASLRWRLNEIYRAELEKAKQKQLREEAQYEPFADHSGAGNGDGNAGTGYQDHGNPACRAG